MAPNKATAIGKRASGGCSSVLQVWVAAQGWPSQKKALASLLRRPASIHGLACIPSYARHLRGFMTNDFRAHGRGEKNLDVLEAERPVRGAHSGMEGGMRWARSGCRGAEARREQKRDAEFARYYRQAQDLFCSRGDPQDPGLGVHPVIRPYASFADPAGTASALRADAYTGVPGMWKEQQEVAARYPLTSRRASGGSAQSASVPDTRPRRRIWTGS